VEAVEEEVAAVEVAGAVEAEESLCRFCLPDPRWHDRQRG